MTVDTEIYAIPANRRGAYRARLYWTNGEGQPGTAVTEPFTTPVQLLSGIWWAVRG